MEIPPRIVEKLGVTPPIILQLIGNSVFVRLADVAENLPPYTERVQLVLLDKAGEDVPLHAVQLLSTIDQAAPPGRSSRTPGPGISPFRTEDAR